MALTGSYTRIWTTPHPTAKSTDTIIYPVELPEDHPYYEYRGTTQSIEVTASVINSQSYESAYVRVQGTTVYSPGEEVGQDYGRELSVVYKVFEKKEDVFVSGSEIERCLLGGIEWNFDTTTNPYEAAYDKIKLEDGMGSLSDC
jgi:hypothetical protein